MVNPQKAVQWYKEKYGETPLSDYDIYEKLKVKFKNQDFTENPFNKKEKPSFGYEEQDPSMWEKMLTYNMADHFAGDNEWMAQAYNKSTAGIIYEIMNGKPKYEVGQAEDWLDEAGQFFVGLASPIDIISFFGSGAVGSMAAKKIGSKTLKKWALQGSKNLVGKKGAARGVNKEFYRYLAREAGLESGLSLGALGATHGALAESAKQSGEIFRGERDEFNPWEITAQSLKHGATNVAIGSVAGYYTKGKMAPKFAKAKIATEKNFQNKLTRLTMNPLGQVAAESAVFTTGQLGEQAISGQPVKFDDFLSGFLMNSAIVGGMRAITKPILRRGQDDATRYKKARKEFYEEVYRDVNGKKVKSETAQTIDSLKEAEKELEKSGVEVPKEIGEKIAELELNKERDLGAASDFNTLIKDYGKILNELNDKKISELPKESQVKLMTELGTIQTVLNKIYGDFKVDKELAYEAYKDYFGGKKLTDKQKLEIDNLIDTKIETTQRGHDMLNGLINGDKDAIKNMKELYSEGFETNISKNKDGKWELSLETPDGSFAELPSYYKLFSTESAAKKAGKSIKDSIKRIITKDEVKESGVKKAENETYYKPISPDGKPLLDAVGKEIVRSAPKEEVALMIERGQAVKPGFDLVNVNQSGKEVSGGVLNKVLTEVKEIKEMGIEEKAISYEMPVKKGTYDRLVKEYNEFKAAPKGKAKSGELNRLKKEVWESGESKDIVSSLAGSDADLITAYKMGEALYAKGLATTPSKNTKVAIKLIGYLNSKNKKLHELSAGELADIVKEGIPKYEISFIKDGETVTRNISSKDIYNSGGVSSLRQMVESLRSLDFISGTKEKLLKSVLEGFDKALNEARGKNIKPAKERVRRDLLERAKQLSQNKNDEGYSIAAKLASKFLIRDEEINRMSPKKLKEALKKDGDDYYLDMSNLKKFKTKDRFVWIDKDLGRSLELYTGDLSKGRYVTDVGRITPSDNTKRLTDTRRRAQTVGGKKLGGAQFRELNYLLGHEISAIQEIYNVSDIASVIKSQKELHKKIGSPISELNPTIKEFYRLGETKIQGDTAKEVHYARKKRLGEKYSEVVIELVKEFKDKSIPEDAVGYLEKAENWAIKVKLGKAPKDVIPHEIIHYVFKVMDAVERVFKGQKLPKQVAKTMNLIKEAKKTFVNKDGKFVEEDAAVMMGKAVDGLLEKPMLAKAKNWFRKFNVWLKGLFNKPMTKEELSFILGERVLERKGIPNPKDIGLDLTQGREYMKTMELDIGKFRNVVNRDIRLASKEMGIERKNLIKFVAEETESIKKASQFRLSLPKDQTADIFFEKTEQLRDFYTTFKSFNLDKFVQKKNAIAKLKIIRRIESLDIREPESRIAKGLTEKAQKSILKNSFGVKDGNLWSASYDQLKRYNDYMYQLKTADRNHQDYILQSEANEFVNLDVAKGTTKAIQEGMFILGEVGDAIDKAGFHTMSKMLKHHYSIQQGNESALLFYEKNVKGILGGIRPDSKMNKINDMMWVMDNRGEMLLEQLKWMNEKISRKDKAHTKKSEKFFRKAIKDNWWDTVKLNKSTKRDIGDALNAKNKQGEYKYLNLDTMEGKIALEYFKLSDAYGREKLELSLLDKAANEAEYQSMVENVDINFLSTHMARNFTDHGKHTLRLEGKAQRESLHKIANEIAYNEAVKRFGKEAVDKDMSLIKKGGEDSPWEYGLGIAAMKFNDMLNFNAAKLSIKHLKKRHSMQEIYLEDSKGNLNRSYEWKWDRTVKPYVWGMSKFYATLEVFPEMVVFEGFSKPGIKDQLARLHMGEGRARKAGRWIEDAFMRQLGLDVSANPYDITFSGLEWSARTLAKTGLSFPTAGAKNILTGQTQTLYAQKAHDWFRGMAKVITADSKAYNEALATNAFGVGNKIYEAKAQTKVGSVTNMLSEFAFWFGGMRPTERFNRLSTIFAAKFDINRQIEKLRNYKPGDSEYKKAETRLKWYEATEPEIKLLSKYGSSEGIGHLKGFEKFQTKRRLDNIHQKMNTYAHVKTQGSSADLFMPKWAGIRGVKPLTLFKRMAYAATSNTIKNIKQAKRDGNLLKPIMGLTATYISGQAMLGIYKTVLGTSMPKENSDWWTRFKTVMWKGELFGILSDWASPFENSDTLNPAIWNSLGSVYVAVDQLGDGKVTKTQAFDQIVKKNLSGYNNYIKIKERATNPLNRDRLRFSKLYRDFEEDVFLEPNIELENTTRTKYFKDLASVFYAGDTTPEEWSEQLALTYVGLAHDYYRTNRADTKAGAFKLAKKALKQKLTGLNPNKATLFKTSRKGKITSLKFFKWLSKHSDAETLIPRLLEIEKEYKIRLNKFNKAVPSVWNKMNLKQMINELDWIQIEF